MVAQVEFQNETYNLTTFQYVTTFLCYSYKDGYEIFPNWENIHLAIYNLIPFCIMTIFNGLLIRNVLLVNLTHSKDNSNNSSQNAKSMRKKQTLTIALIFVTILFLVMTLPSSIIFGFFFDFFDQHLGQSFLLMVDHLSFTNNASLFFISMITNAKFRNVIFAEIGKFFGRNSVNNNSKKPNKTTHAEI